MGVSKGFSIMTAIGRNIRAHGGFLEDVVYTPSDRREKKCMHG